MIFKKMIIKKIILLFYLFFCILLLSAKSNKPLTDAIIQGDLQKVERIIGRGADINFSDNYQGYSPLMCAIMYSMYNKKEIVEVLLKAKADVNALDKNGNSVLYYAIYNNRTDISIIESLVNNGADINIKINNNPILMYAIEYDNKALFDILLKAKADVNVQDSNGYTPLIYAVKNRKKEIIEALLNAKADVNAKDKGGNSGLYYAVNNNDPEIAELLVKNGATGHSILINAVKNNYIGLVESLLKAKADVNATDNEGRTPLMWALIQKDKDIIKILLDEKANVNAVDKSGNSVLYYALENTDLEVIELLINNGLNLKNIKKSPLSYLFFQYYQINPNKNIKEVYPIIELLLKKGANVNEKSNSYPQDTILIDACKNDDLQNVKLLLKYGAEVNITNEDNSNALHFTTNIEIARLLINSGINIHLVNINGWTPLFTAVGEPEILSELIKRKAKVNIKDKEGGTPLMKALRPNSIESIKMLLDAGASVNEKGKYGYTILQQAIIYTGNIDIIKLLIYKGAKVDRWILKTAASNKKEEIFNYLLNNHKFTSVDLGTALFNGIVEGMSLSYTKVLLEKGADVNLYFLNEKGRQTTPLLTAIRKGNGGIEIVKLLLDYGAEIKSKEANWGLMGLGASNDGDNALDIARKNGNKELIALLEKGNIWDDVIKGNIDNVKEYCKTKNVNIKTAYYKENLLFHAIRNNKTEIAGILIEAGIDINDKNFDHELTALILAVEKNNLDIVKLLLNAKTKININAQERFGLQTALHIAVINNNLEIVKLLIEAKANPNIGDESGNTPYSLAHRRGYKEIEELLLKHGAKKSEHKEEGGK